MKIYSWNILYRNRELDRAFDFISKSDFDIFCLQEVPEEFLTRLKTLPFSIASRIEVERLLPQGIVPNYGVILSRYPITQEGGISFPDYWTFLPLRTRLFVRLMPSRYFSRIRKRGGQHAEVALGHTSVRILNLHLVQAHPEWRLQELETALATYDPIKPVIICGDFNTHDKPYTAPLNWILGGRASDALYYGRERARVDRMILAHGLVNPLGTQVTHHFSQSQLDHILVSRSFSIKNAVVLPERYGSDHNPIFVELT
ncbi:endonuclease/exonuclease/phosphatase family protein [Candidatus Kaiserbacteria bacterium]|nr:endonuclease/exonuclease/phosphatase family protein [Candidatus Kaiserbacteria bacterium]